MKIFENLSGLRRHMLVAKELVGYQKRRFDGARQALWLCECDCGQTAKYPAVEFKRGRVKSCGCLRINADAPLQSLFASYRYKAKARNKEWSLTFEQFKLLVLSPCFYTGLLPFQKYIMRGRRKNRTILYNGIDRVNNRKGYTMENCVSCCGMVNKAKLAMEQKEFIAMCKLVAMTAEERL